MFKKLKDWMLELSAKPNAVYYLAILSYVEAIIFPIPTDVMLVPMIIAKPKRAWRYAFVTMIFSVLGGITIYLIAYFAFDTVVEPVLLNHPSAKAHYLNLLNWVEAYGVWIFLLLGLIPTIPYKLLSTVAAIVNLPFAMFIVFSVICRSIRFFLVAKITTMLTPQAKQQDNKA